MSSLSVFREFAEGQPPSVAFVERNAQGALVSWVENGFNMRVTRAASTVVLTASRQGMQLTETLKFDAQGRYIGSDGISIPTVLAAELRATAPATGAPGAVPGDGNGLGDVALTGTPSAGQTIVATSPTAAQWQPLDASGLPTDQANAVAAATVDGRLTRRMSPTLANWFAGKVDGGHVYMAGDSTVLQMFTGGAITTGGPASVLAPARYSAVGGELPGVTFYNWGANGNTLALFNANLPSGLGIDSLISALNANTGKKVLIFSYGINDVRQGATTKAQLKVLLTAAINRLIGEVAGLDIVLRMPNSFLTTNVGGLNYVTPNGSAQDYSIILRDAYRELEGEWANVVLYDSQRNAFSEVSPATSPQMVDQIHPSTQGYRFLLDQIVTDIIGASAQRAFVEGRTGAARLSDWRNGLARTYNAGSDLEAVAAVGVRLAPTLYPQIVLNGDYDLVAAGYANSAVTAGQASLTVRDFQPASLYRPPSSAAGFVRQDDVCVQLTDSGAFACLLSTSGSPAGGTANTTALAITNGFSASSPTALVAQASGQPVLIYRHKYGNSAAIKALMIQPQYRATALFRVNASGDGTLQIVKDPAGLPLDTQWTFRAGDVLVFDDIGSITLTSAMTMTMNSSGALLTINQSGTNFTTAATYVGVIGSGKNRGEVNAAAPIRIDVDGVLTATTLNRYFTRAGRYKVMSAWLDTPDATTATTVVIRTVMAGNFALAATVTFAPGANVGTVAYTFESNFVVLPNVRVGFVITPGGAGAAGLHLAFDQ